MKPHLPDDVEEFGRVALRRLTGLGGVEAALAAETDDSIRHRASTALAEIGFDDLDVSDGDDLLAAAVLCRAAGRVALPYPVVEGLVRVDSARTTLIDPGTPRVDHGDLTGPWVGLDLDGYAYDLAPARRPTAKLGPFLVPATARRRSSQRFCSLVDLHLTLGSWRILGAIEYAFSATIDHVRNRHQFGQALADFQTIRFSLADLAVAVRGLTELAKFTVSRVGRVPAPNAAADALALRIKADHAAGEVLRTCHQLFGASGFCDETGISVLDRHLQPLLRYPAGVGSLTERLVVAVGHGHLENPFAEQAR